MTDRTWTEAEVVALIAAGCYASPPTEEQMRDGALRAEIWLATHDEAVRAEEREKCVQIALSAQLGTHWTASNGLTLAMSVMRDIADRIRAQGEEQGND